MHDVENGGHVLIETLWNVNSQKPSPQQHSIRCINRNIVECKSTLKLTSILLIARINRNIVECKLLYYSRKASKHGTSINRNIVECKYIHEKFCDACEESVLIETLWNVNIVHINMRRLCDIVLIETLWNVNSSTGVRD